MRALGSLDRGKEKNTNDSKESIKFRSAIRLLRAS